MRPERLVQSWRRESDRTPGAPVIYRHPSDLDRRVMDMLRTSNHPLGAYEIARQSRQNGSPLAPNQVYRILDRLIERGEVRRVELLSSYMPAQQGKTGIAVCKECGTVTTFEAGNLASRLEEICRAEGFASDSAIIEVPGTCSECSARRAGAAPIRRVGGMAMLFALLSLAGGSTLGGVAGADPVLAAAENEKSGRARLFESKTA